jgi:hypothetical protein
MIGQPPSGDDGALGTWPMPPSHFSQFHSGPTAMQPPDISTIGPTYRQFGQVVENPNFGVSTTSPPPIDRDMMVYDPSVGVKNEIVRLVGTLKNSVTQLIRGIQNTPNNNKPLRDFDSRIKSLFHALESLRPVEAKESVIKFMEAEINLRRDMNERIDSVIRKLGYSFLDGLMYCWRIKDVQSSPLVGTRYKMRDEAMPCYNILCTC